MKRYPLAVYFRIIFSVVSIRVETIHKIIFSKVSIHGGCIAERLSSNPEAPGSILGVPKNLTLDVADNY